jgi:hypothetical protein
MVGPGAIAVRGPKRQLGLPSEALAHQELSCSGNAVLINIRKPAGCAGQFLDLAQGTENNGFNLD